MMFRYFAKEQRFRLIALPALDEQTTAEQPTLAERFAGRVGRLSFDPPDLSERAEEYFGKLIVEKHQKTEE